MVELQRADTGEKVRVKDAEFEKLMPVTGDPNASVEDLVNLPDVNMGAVLANLKDTKENR